MDTADSRFPEAPLALHTETVRPQWIDFNGHMNVAYYVLAFDHATDVLFDRLGLGVAYVERERRSMFIVEIHVSYLREVGEGDRLRFTSQLLGFDPKRLHLFHRMYRNQDANGEESPVATLEQMLVHVDLEARRSTAMPPAAMERIERLAAAHAGLPRPPQAGRIIGLGGGKRPR